MGARGLERDGEGHNLKPGKADGIRSRDSQRASRHLFYQCRDPGFGLYYQTKYFHSPMEGRERRE
jgi:hypothetical protein